MSAMNFFSRGDFLSKVADFCTELKRLASGARTRENVEPKMNENPKEKEKETKQPFQELPKEESRDLDINGSHKQQRRKKRIQADLENTPPTISSKKKEFSSSPQIRTCPPTPQCFSAAQGKAMASCTKPLEPRTRGGVLREMDVADKETRSVDALWFLKPCTLSG